MDRQIVYPGQIPLDTDILTIQRNAMVALGYLAQATLGTSTVVDGMACTPTGPASMSFNVGPGSIIALSTVDATAFGSLPADTSDPVVKMGVNIASTQFTVTAPGTTGQSINYLVEAAFQESDATPVVLPYYNASNPAVAYSGPANSGTSQNTQRLQRVNLQIKAGSPASTGSQVTPTPDSGFVGLFVITVAYAQTTVTAGNISTLSTAPFLNAVQGMGLKPGRLLNIQTFKTAGSFTYTPTIGTNSIEVELAGGGGAGGGASITSSTQVAAGTGGGGGGIARKRVTSGFAGVTVTVGAGGTASAGAAGGSGGSTSFGALVSATGGSGGSLGAALPQTTNSFGGFAQGGNGSGGDWNGTGQGGQAGFYAAAPIGGKGGGSPYGDGAPYVGGGASSAGFAAQSAGSGGSGGVLMPSASSTAMGGAGAAGMVIVREYA